MSYFYPHDLIDSIIGQWYRHQEIFQETQRTAYNAYKATYTSDERPTPSFEPAPFPVQDTSLLKTMLETMYHVSFLTEESRRTTARIAYMLPETLTQLDPPIKFLPPIQFTVSEILRLAPAVEPRQSVLIVCPSAVMNMETSESGLAIWGILNIGTKWYRTVSERQYGVVKPNPPTKCLIISTFAQGSITVSTEGIVLARLRVGKLLHLSLGELNRGYIGEFLSGGAELLYRDVCQRLGVQQYYAAEGIDSHVKSEYYRVLSNIINSTQERKHGGIYTIAGEYQY